MQLINFNIQFLHIDIQVQAIYRLFLIIQQIKYMQTCNLGMQFTVHDHEDMQVIL